MVRDFFNPPTPAGVPPRNPTSGLVIWAWLLAVLVPLVGFILGAIAVAKGRTGHGVLTMILALAMVPLWPVMVAGLLFG